MLFERLAFVFYISELKYDVAHLSDHEIVGEMGINSADKPFGRIAHPNIYDVGTDVLLTDGGKSVP